MDRIKAIFITVALIVVIGLARNNTQLRKGKEIAEQNATTLLQGVNQYKAKNSELLTTVDMMSLKISEYKKYRAEDAEKLKDLGLKFKNLESVAKTEVEANIKLREQLSDTTVAKVDPVTKIVIEEAKYKKVNIQKPFLKIQAMITDNEIIGDIKIPIRIDQYIEAIYKHKFLWWRWKVIGFKQTISVDNPYVDVKYAEVVKIRK